MFSKVFAFFAIVAFLVGFAGTGIASINGNPDAVVGTWLVGEKDAKVEIFKCGNKYCGKIIWTSEKRTDKFNPDTKLRTRDVVGVQLMNNFAYDSKNNEWSGGSLYNTRDGKTYSGYMQLNANGTLFLKGYVLGIRWLGKSDTWTRVK